MYIKMEACSKNSISWGFDFEVTCRYITFSTGNETTEIYLFISP